jgi:hypothetical protein
MVTEIRNLREFMHKVIVKWKNHMEKKNTATRREMEIIDLLKHYRINENYHSMKLVSVNSCMRALSEQIEVNTH